MGERGSRLSPDWKPSAEDIAWAEKMVSNWNWEFQKFRDYWLAKGGQSACKLDWSLTFRNWIRNAVERYGANTASKPPMPVALRTNSFDVRKWLATQWEWVKTENGMRKVWRGDGPDPRLSGKG